MEKLAFSIANGLLLNALRSAARRSRLEEALVLHASTQVNEAPDPADLVIRPRSCQLDALMEMFVRLPIRERETLAYFVEGYRISEIAAILDKRPGAISMRLQRARQRLRVLVSETTYCNGSGQDDKPDKGDMRNDGKDEEFEVTFETPRRVVHSN